MAARAKSKKGKRSKAAKLARLRRLNLTATLFFAAQAVILLLLAQPAELPVRGDFLRDAPGTGLYGAKDLFDLRIDWMVAVFLLLAAVDHLFVATVGRHRYERDVPKGSNPARWWEYSVSASIMVVLIAMLAGASDIVALLMMFGANAAMILFGLVMERSNLGKRKVDWSPFVWGCVIGAVPWIGIAVQLALSQDNGDGVPGFVFGIFVSLFILFNTFAVNMWLGYRGKGRWKDPLFVELVYVILSFTAKTVLAWQVYAGSLAGTPA
ncbi:MAG: heliorhodopsin HeR [bacterium]